MGQILSTIAARSKRARFGKAAERAVVLIVEDEALIRMNAVHMVEDAGYIALEAGDAVDATAILKKRRDIGAVFTDVTMSGGSSGLKLAHAIRRRWPPIHLVVTSGQPGELKLPSRARFIRKPYENARVVALLRELFEGD